MKRVEAIIRPHKLNQVLEALDQAGVSGVTVVETIGFGRQRGHSEVYRGSDESFGLVHKRMVIVYVKAEQAAEIVRCIAEAARTGQVGDGKIVVCDVEHAVRIRTGDENGVAVTREQ